MEITIDNKINCQNVPETLQAELKGRLSFQNPKFLKNARLNYSNWNVPRILKYYEVSDNGDLILPRGYARS